MKLSIILPVYNVEEYLEECLDSLVNQDYTDYEIIAINDGSKDNSLKILRRYEKKYPKLIKVYDRENGGVSRARNYGIEKAKGKYIFFVDSDDYILPNSLHTLDKYLNENHDVIVYPFVVGDEKHSEMEPLFGSNVENPQKRLIIGKPGSQNKICKKSIYIKNKITFLEDVYYEDLATMPKLALYSNDIKFIEEPLYFYRVRQNSIMTKKEYNSKVDGIFKVVQELREYFGDKYRDEIEYLHIEHLLRSASIRYLGYENCQHQLDKIVNTIKEYYPNWKKNKYYQKENIKKRIMCNLLYNKKYKIVSLLRKL